MIGVGGLFLYLNPLVEQASDSTVEDVFPDSIWEMAFDDLYDQWVRGVDINSTEFKSNCPQYTSLNEVSRELRSCRPALLSCYYKGRITKLSHKKNWYEFRLKFPRSKEHEGQYTLFSPASEARSKGLEYALQVKVELSKDGKTKSKNIFLKDNCRQVEIPQGFYRYGSQNTKNLWHTSYVSYSIDKHLVRNLDVEEWLSQLTTSALAIDKISFEKGEPYEPASALTTTQMKRYCAFRGSQILSSRVLDTITYHHGRVAVEEISTRAPGPNPSPYPFGPRLIDSPHYFALKNKLKATNQTCQKINSLECLELVPNLLSWGVGWSGVREILGGPLEYVENKEMPRRNLKLSSFYFPLKSKVHMAGVRGFWNGEDYKRQKSFNFFRYSAVKSSEKYKVGFRCMKLSGGFE